MTDRYVIVYRDGSYGMEFGRQTSDLIVACDMNLPRTVRPAYRIRCREKMPVAISNISGQSIITKAFENLKRPAGEDR